MCVREQLGAGKSIVSSPKWAFWRVRASCENGTDIEMCCVLCIVYFHRRNAYIIPENSWAHELNTFLVKHECVSRVFYASLTHEKPPISAQIFVYFYICIMTVIAYSTFHPRTNVCPSRRWTTYDKHSAKSQLLLLFFSCSPPMAHIIHAWVVKKLS